MSQKPIDAILWRSYLAATSSALWQLNTSQYYFELPRTEPDYIEFFGDSVMESQDYRGNKVFTINLEPFEGENMVARYELKCVKLREGVQRAGNWQVLDQNGELAYALWQKERGPLRPFQNMDEEERQKNFIVIARDVDGCFHGRWIRDDDFLSLPPRVKHLLETKAVGWSQI